MRTLAIVTLPLAGCCFAPTPGGAPAATPAPAVAPALAPTPATGPATSPAPALTPEPAGPTPVAVPAAPRVRVEGFDLRATVWTSPLYVLQRGRPPAPTSDGDSDGDLTLWRLGAGDGSPVRVLLQNGSTCDGTMGARVRLRADYLDVESEDRDALASEIDGCDGQALFAIVHPTPGAPWPETLPDMDPAATSALEAARAAMTTLARGAAPASFDAHAYRLEDAVYGLAWGPRCEDEEDPSCGPVGSALVVVRPGAAPETLIVRRVHYPWDEPTSAFYAPCGVLDVDGDGRVELCERMGADQGGMIRLVRPGDSRAGEAIWRMDEATEYALPQAGPAPAALP